MHMTETDAAATRDRFLTAALFAFLYLPFLYHFGYRLRGAHFIDLPSFYWGAKLAFLQSLSPYGPHAFALAEGAADHTIFPYLYPPPSLTLFYPLTLFDYDTAKLLVLAMNHLAFLGVLYLLWYRIAPGVRTTGPAAFTLFLVYALGFAPVASTIAHGQINLIVAALLLLSWQGLREHGGGARVGIPLALAILLKTYPLLFLPLLLFRRRYDAAAWTLGTVAAISLAAVVTLPIGLWRDWFVYVLPSGGYGEVPLGLFSPANAANQSLNAFFQRLFVPNEFTPVLLANPELAKTAAYAAAAVIGGITLWLSYRARRHAGAVDLEFALYLLTMYLLAPLSWEHHLVFMLPAVTVLLLHVVRRRRYAVLALFALPCAMALAWTLPKDFVSLSGAIGVLALSAKLYAVLGLWFLGALLLALEGRSAAGAGDRQRIAPRAVMPSKIASRA